MNKFTRKIVVFMLVLIGLGIIGFGTNIYAKNSNTGNNQVLSQKFSAKKLERIRASIKTHNSYRFLIDSNQGLDNIKDFFIAGDKKAKVKQVGKNTFMVRLPLNTTFLKDELTQIDSGVLPLNIGGYDVIQPEIVESKGIFNSLLNPLSLQEKGATLGTLSMGLLEGNSTGTTVKVGVLDTGIDYNHSDLANHYDSLLSYDFINEDNDAMDDNGHGTQVSGLITDSELVGLKVLDANGLGTTYDILEAIDYAKTNNIKVLNMSFGGMGDASTSAVCQAITDAKNNGMYTIVSAGNSNTSITNLIPASCSDAITIGATDSQNNKASFSNYGTGVMLYAAGVDINTTTLNNSYTIVSGTSFSAAKVTGLVAKELTGSGGISYSGVIENINTKYNLLSSIYDPSLYPNQETVYASGEVLPATGTGLAQTFYEEGVFSAEANIYPSISSNSVWNCGFQSTATFSNGYMLKHRTIAQDFTKNIGRTELWKNGVMIDYQDNIFFSTAGAPYFGGNSCYLFSMFKSVVLKENGVIDIDYYFWDGFRWNYGVQPTKFNINKKSISDISVSTSVFGYPAHFYIKLNLKDKNISTTTNIASQGYLDYIWGDYYASNGSWLWGGIGFGTSGCSVSAINENTSDYNISYDCTVHKYYGGGAANGGSSTDTSHIYGHFSLSKNDYDLCAYDNKFCAIPNKPTNLKQEIINPHLERIQEVKLGEKIEKYQSGSGIILSANIENNVSGTQTRLVFEIYKKGETIPFKTQYTHFSGDNSYTEQVILPYLGDGDYYWKVKTVNQYGFTSDFIDFSTSDINEVDYSLYEGFEPFPYGYSFFNTIPAEGSLTGGVLNVNSGNNIDFYSGPSFRVKLNGNKWDLFNSAFDTTDLANNQSKLFDAFETVFSGALIDGSCYGMSISAVMAKNHTDYIEKFNSNYLDILGTGTVYDIPKPLYDENGWTESNNDILNTIYSMQLSMKSKRIQELAINGSGSVDDIFTILNGNPDKTYILYFGTEKLVHAVVPYQTEDNGLTKKIYYWDNTVPYPEFNKYKAYDQYIEISSTGSWDSPKWKDELDGFSLVGIMDTEEIYNVGKSSAPIGFNGNDYLYMLNGSSDIIVTDLQGRVSGFINGEIKREIPGVNVIIPFNNTLTGSFENTAKQIYLPQKQEGLTVKVISKSTESYDLMIAGGDYYTKLEGVETTTGQVDTFKSTREKLNIDFDDTKIGDYNLLTDNFYNNGTGTVYIDSVKSIQNPQQYTISWTGVLDNANDSVKYEIDSDNDGIYDKTTNLPPIFQDLITPTTTNSFSGTFTAGYSTGSYIETVNINLNAIDNEGGAGIDKTYYAIGTNTGTLEYTSYSGAVIINGLGDYTLNYYSVDKFGNIEENKTINFTLTERPETYNGVISGYVYDDVNNNGIQETTENKMAGWKVCIDKNNDNTCQENIEPFILTNNDGYYELNGLSKGLYKIIEIPHTNWNITSPTNLYYDINLGIGQEVVNKNFGNYKYKGNNIK